MKEQSHLARLQSDLARRERGFTEAQSHPGAVEIDLTRSGLQPLANSDPNADTNFYRNRSNARRNVCHTPHARGTPTSVQAANSSRTVEALRGRDTFILRAEVTLVYSAHQEIADKPHDE